MSDDADSEFNIYRIRHVLEMTSGDCCQWDRLCAWLAEHAPESPTRAAVERIVALNKEAISLIDALMDRKMIEAGDHTITPPKYPRWTCPPLDAIARWWGGDGGEKEALEAIAAWSLPRGLHEPQRLEHGDMFMPGVEEFFTAWRMPSGTVMVMLDATAANPEVRARGELPTGRIWGVLLDDFAKHIATAYANSSARDADGNPPRYEDVRAAIHEGYLAEAASPTDTVTTPEVV